MAPPPPPPRAPPAGQPVLVEMRVASVPRLCDALVDLHAGMAAAHAGDTMLLSVAGRGSRAQPEVAVLVRLTSVVATLFGWPAGPARWCDPERCRSGGCGVCGYDCVVLLDAWVHAAHRRTGVLSALVRALLEACAALHMSKGVLVPLSPLAGRPHLLGAALGRADYTVQRGGADAERFAVFSPRRA